METKQSRRRFLRDTATAAIAGSGGLWQMGAGEWEGVVVAAETPDQPSKRVFVAGFSHETNTFHPLKTTSFHFREPQPKPGSASRRARETPSACLLERPWRSDSVRPWMSKPKSCDW